MHVPPHGPKNTVDAMRTTDRPILGALLVVCVISTVGSVGCSRRDYRIQADEDVYATIENHSQDPRWCQPGFSIEYDPRSRYYDPYDPDHQPMPADDPDANVFMQRPGGMRGWPHWERDGVRYFLENPCWRERLVEYLEPIENGKYKLTLDSALELTYIHSPQYQQQLETVYLSAIDLTSERFFFQTQFFGGNLTSFTHTGRLRGPFGERNTLQTDSSLRANRLFATGGTLAVGLANSIVWQFAGPDTNSNVSIANFSLIQPLLRQGGRVISLERLTRSERILLYNLRSLERYRQGQFGNVALGDAGVQGPQRSGGLQGGTGLTGFTGQGTGGLGGVGQGLGFGNFLGFGQGGANVGAAGGGLAAGGAGVQGGFLGLVQQAQQIRNVEYSLAVQLRTLALLEANLEAGLLDLTQVDQFRQSIESARANLLQSQVGLQNGVDTFVRQTLGLPPDMQFELDDSFVQQFQLITPEISALQARLAQTQASIGELPDNPSAEELQSRIADAGAVLQGLTVLFEPTLQDLGKAKSVSESRKQGMSADDQKRFDDDLKSLNEEFAKRKAQAETLETELQGFEEKLTDANLEKTLTDLVAWTRRLDDEIQSLSLIQARARVESVELDPIKLGEKDALNIARNMRFDYMNSRASLVDQWRLIAFNANALRSGLTVGLSGDVQTRGDNPVNFNGHTGSLRASLQFDAPLTRLLERNNYRNALISYQTARRNLIQFDDQLNQTMREHLRTFAQLEANMEIQRRAVAIAIRRVDFTRAELNRPLPVPVPGEPPPTFGPTAVQNLLLALQDLSNVQNNFMSVWIAHYAERMGLMRDLGIMELDERGRWIDRPLGEVLAEIGCNAETQLPPDVSSEYWEAVESGDVENAAPKSDKAAQPAGKTDANQQPQAGTPKTNGTTPAAEEAVAPDDVVPPPPVNEVGPLIDAAPQDPPPSPEASLRRGTIPRATSQRSMIRIHQPTPSRRHAEEQASESEPDSVLKRPSSRRQPAGNVTAKSKRAGRWNWPFGS